MDYLQSHTKKRSQKFINKRLTQEQISFLEESFSCNNKLDSDRKSQLAKELNLPPRQIAIWYQNKRARWKNQSLEVDYKILEKRLESVLCHNVRLGREAEMLKEELAKAKEMIVSLNYGGHNTSISSISNSCDDMGTPSLVKFDNHHLDKDLFYSFLGVEELFHKPQCDGFFSP